MVTRLDVVRRKLALAVLTRDCRIVRRLLASCERVHRHVACEYVADDSRLGLQVVVEDVDRIFAAVSIRLSLKFFETITRWTQKPDSL